MLHMLVVVLLATVAHGQQIDENKLKLLNNIFDDGTSSAVTTVGATTAPVTTAAPTTSVGVVTKSGVVSCTTEGGLQGECVPYYLCNDNNSIITDGFGMIDIRFQEGECPAYDERCCEVPNILPEDKPITPTPPPPEKVRQGCGWRNPNGIAFGIKGDVDNEAKFGEFPWMVAILKTEPVNGNVPEVAKLNVYVGGGSLINPSVVLTGAHVVFNRTQLVVRVGEWDTQSTNEIYPYQEREVKEVVIHKDFNRGNLFYDVALLFLSEPVDMSKPHIGLACLPEQGAKAKDGTRCQAAGWGKNEFGKEGQYQVILKRVEVPTVEQFDCQDKLRTTRLGKYFMLHSTFMCAGGEPGKDTCKGDGGSPLVCPIEYEEERYMQYGIVAWGIGCKTDGLPGVYVNVATLRNWIDDKVAGGGFSRTTYVY